MSSWLENIGSLAGHVFWAAFIVSLVFLQISWDANDGKSRVIFVGWVFFACHIKYGLGWLLGI